MLTEVAAALRCPHCREGLRLEGRTASCRSGHAFDLAKQGYLNLLPSASTGIDGDTADMVAARTAFLGEGHYQPIRDALAGLVSPAVAGVVVEVGAGTAYYLASVVGVTPDRIGIALDVSRYAARRAAKAHERIGAVVADAWRELPLLDNSAQILLNVFAPRNAAEMARVLTHDGTLLVVTPNPGHLAELIDVLGLVKVDESKDARLTSSLGGHFTRADDVQVERVMKLDHHSIRNLVAMGPSAFHTEAGSLTERLATLPDPADVTLSVTISTWHPTSGGGTDQLTG